MPAPYVELHSHSNFSFLDGGSHPYELAVRAAELEMPALAITDRGGVYGSVRHLQACRKLGVKPIIGSALEVDGEELILIARNLRGYSHLCRLLTLAHADQPKGEARTTLATVAEHRSDLFFLSPTDHEQRLRELQVALGEENVFSELHHHRRPEDEWVLEGRAAMARRCGARVVATNEVHYHVAERRRLHDVLVAIRHRATLDDARAHLFPNSEHHLKGGADLIVAYVLGITRVDPIEHNLLFERFLHEEMTSTPDIDIDFSTEHREQVIQYIYEKYGWERTGMVCNVVTFQPRMAIRQVGKALGFSAELLDRLAKGVDRWFTEDVEDSMTGAVPPSDMRPQSWQQFLELCREVIEFPRHLSIHNGGMLVTGEPLVDIAPVEPAAMEGRRVVQFNKDDVEDLGLIKMDMLGLRTLSVVAEALEQIIEIAMYVAGMKPGRADGFRRAMTRHLNRVEMSSLEDEFIGGCLANDVPREVADQLFAAVQGFAVYGFCRSHAAAFARTSYETAWMKLHHPVEFGCGLLNNQPMGFYHPSVLVEDLKRHGLKALPVDVNRSDVRCLPEALPDAASDQLPATAGSRGLRRDINPASAGTRGESGRSSSAPQLAGGPPFGSRPLPRLPTDSSVLSE